jgi:hypothetical protein
VPDTILFFLSVSVFFVGEISEREKKSVLFRLVRPGANAMITIFFDFRQFALKMAPFLKNQCYDQFFHKKTSSM